MAEIVTVARPYAEGLFRLAKESNTFAKWSEVLGVMAAVVADDAGKAVVTNPQYSAAQVKSLLADVLGAKADAEVLNLIDALQENGRLIIVPEIACQYETLKDAANNTVEAEIVSAFPMDDAQVKGLSGKLEAKFGCKISPKVSVDPDLIGGVRVTVGDEVLDASVRAKLQAMAYRLKS